MPCRPSLPSASALPAFDQHAQSCAALTNEIGHTDLKRLGQSFAALGAWLGGLAIAWGYGYAATGYVGAALSFLGLLVFGASVALERRSTRALCQA